MADIRLAIAVDSAGAIQSVRSFNSEVDRIPGAASKAGGGVSALTRQFESFASGLGIGTGIAVAIKGFDLLAAGARELVSVLTGAAKSLGEYSDKMVTIGQRTGLTVASLQTFNAMAKTAGTDVESLSKAAVKMEVAIQKGDSAFQRLGLSLSALKAMSPDQAFAKVSSAIGSIEDPMQRAAAAVAIFGKSGAEMLPVFASNMEDAKRKAEEFGLVLGDKTVTSAEALGDAVDLAGMAFEALLMRLAGIVAQSPAVIGAVEYMSKAFGELSKEVDGNQSALGKWVDYGLDVAADAVWALIFAIQKAVSAIGILSGAAFGGASGWFSGIDSALQKMRNLTEETRQAMIAKSKWAAIDMGGKGVLLPGRSLSSGGGGGFIGEDAAKASIKAAKDAAKAWASFLEDIGKSANATSRAFVTSLADTNRQLVLNMLKGSGTPGPLQLPMPEIATKLGEWSLGAVGAYAPAIKASQTFAQSLQNLANVFQLAQNASGKLGQAARFMATTMGNMAAIMASRDRLKTATGTLEKFGEYGQIAAAVLSIGSSIFSLFRGRKKETAAPEPPKQATAEAWRNYVTGQQTSGAAGVLAGVSGIRVTTPEDMAAQASIASQSFWAMFKQQGLIKAADAFKAVRDKMIETFKAAGASDDTISALLGPMSQMVDLAGNDAFRVAADGSQGFAEALAAIANQQLPMTIDQFRAFEQQALAGYEQMKQAAIAQGLSAEDAIKSALRGSAQYIQTLRDAAAKYGIDLGQGTQDLIDLAGESGIALATDVQERLILSLDALTETLGGAPPRFEQAIANGANRGGGNRGQDIGDSISADLRDLGDRISVAVGNLPQPRIYLDTGVLVGGIADEINSGMGNGLLTAIEGRK